MKDRKTILKSLIIKRLNLKISVEDFKDDSLLFGTKSEGGIGLDSVDALEIAVGIMNEFDVEVTDEDMQYFKSVNTIDEFILSKQLTE